MPKFEQVENFPARTDDLPSAKGDKLARPYFCKFEFDEDSFEAYIADIEER